MTKVRRKREEITTRYQAANSSRTVPKTITPLKSLELKQLTEQNCETNNDDTLAKSVLEHLMLSYDRKTVPVAEGVNVKVDLIVQAISSISEMTASFTADVFLVKFGLTLDWHSKMLPSTCLANLTLSHRTIDDIWLPNVCFQNSKSTSIHSSPTPNIFLLIYPNGTIWVNYRVKVEAPCELDMSSFPMDVQRCTMTFESYSFNVGRVRLDWFETAVILDLQYQSIVYNSFNNNKQMQSMLIIIRKLPDFELTTYAWQKQQFYYPAGQWDQLKATFYFRRTYGYYILQLYMPTYASLDSILARSKMLARPDHSWCILSDGAYISVWQRGSKPTEGFLCESNGCLDICIHGIYIFSLVELAIVGYVDKITEKKNDWQKKFAEKIERQKNHIECNHQTKARKRQAENLSTIHLLIRHNFEELEVCNSSSINKLIVIKSHLRNRNNYKRKISSETQEVTSNASDAQRSQNCYRDLLNMTNIPKWSKNEWTGEKKSQTMIESETSVQQTVSKFAGEEFDVGNMRTVFAGASKDSMNRTDRVILLIGPIGSNKSSLIDCMCNYFYGAKFDDIRYKIADEIFDQGSTPMKSITKYVFNATAMPFRPIIIDTPEIVSDSGIPTKEATACMLRNFLLENQHIHISALCLVLKYDDVSISKDGEIVQEQMLFFQ
ncbi:hypothetical protein DINM_006269 [Dirofilaria immitis]|nr:hypothetical protein [Dirofilaria immitis]